LPCLTTSQCVAHIDESGNFEFKAVHEQPDAGNWDNPVVIREILTPPPKAPSNLTATAVSISQINLAWVDNSTDEEGFNIERSLDGVNYTLLATVDPNVTTYSDTGLTPLTTCYYDVYAYNANGNSDYARPSATTPDNNPP